MRATTRPAFFSIPTQFDRGSPPFRSRPRRRRRELVLGSTALVWAAILTGCASAPPPEPWAVPDLAWRLERYAGDPTTGPVAPTEALDPTAATVHCTVWSLREFPSDMFGSLGGRARLVLDVQRTAPLPGVSRFWPDARMASGRTEELRPTLSDLVQDRGQSAPWQSLATRLPAASTAAFVLGPGRKEQILEYRKAGLPAPNTRFELHVTADGKGGAVQLALRTVAPDPASTAHDQEEVLLIDTGLRSDQPGAVVLLLPNPLVREPQPTVPPLDIDAAAEGARAVRAAQQRAAEERRKRFRDGTHRPDARGSANGASGGRSPSTTRPGATNARNAEPAGAPALPRPTPKKPVRKSTTPALPPLPPALVDPTSAVAVWIEYLPPTTLEPTAARRALADQTSRYRKDRKRRHAPPTERLDAARNRSALYALDKTSQRRNALLMLGQTLDAPMVQTFALAATDDELEALVEELRDPETFSIPAQELSLQPELGWTLSRALLAVLVTRIERDELSAQLQALLIEHAGELARDSATLRSARSVCMSLEDIRVFVRNRNLEYLSASDPAARVRAFDWLTARDLAPADYDPLADKPARRQALRAFERAEADREQAAAEAARQAQRPVEKTSR